MAANTPVKIHTGSYSGTVNVKNLYPNDYTNFTVNNFLYKPQKVYAYYSSPNLAGTRTVTGTASYSYNPSTGILTYNTGYAFEGTGDVYAIQGYLSSVEIYLIP